MVLINVSKGSVYLSCFRQSLPRGGRFSVPWDRVRNDRGVLNAIRSGALICQDESDDRDVMATSPGPSGSGGGGRYGGPVRGVPAVEVAPEGAPVPAEEAVRAELAEAEARRAEETSSAEKAAEGARAASAEAVKANAASRGKAKPKRQSRPQQQRRPPEPPVTEADIIADVPASLQAIDRHNRAVGAVK